MLGLATANFSSQVELSVPWDRKPGVGTPWRKVWQACLASGVYYDAVCCTHLVGDGKIIQRALGRQMSFRVCFRSWRGKRTPIFNMR